MRAPSTKRLRAEFPQLQRGQATLIRKLAKAVHNAEKLKELVDKHLIHTAGYTRRCYNDPYVGKMWRRTVMLEGINEILGTYGVEALGMPGDGMHDGPPFQYCNAGDPYVATIIYSRESDTLRIGCWGDIAERHPRW